MQRALTLLLLACVGVGTAVGAAYCQPVADRLAAGRTADAAVQDVMSPKPPPLPRSSLQPHELALIVAEGDASSEAIARAYQRARGIPEANLVRVAMATSSDVISSADFADLKARIDAALPAHVQATLLTFMRPSRVQGLCSMGITSALALGYDAGYCGGCARTKPSPYFDTDTTRPFSDLAIRPSMMLGAANLAEAQTLIQRGLAAEGSRPAGVGYLVRTNDAARSVRHPDWVDLPAAWAGPGGFELRYLDNSAVPMPPPPPPPPATPGASASASAPAPAPAPAVSDQTRLMFYFTGQTHVPGIHGNRWLPGAVADHLTSSAGVLPDGASQMPITEWLRAGASASYGTVEEPCNHVGKFPKVSVLLEHYQRGATLIEAYWKSVATPGQGLFVGDPLARPWPDVPSSQIIDGVWTLQTRSLRRGALYRAEWRANANAPWQPLSSFIATRPQPSTWRVVLPTPVQHALAPAPGTPAPSGGQLRWMGPCPTAAVLTCELSRSD